MRPEKVDLGPVHRRNLERLADFLESPASDYIAFDMGSWIGHSRTVKWTNPHEAQPITEPGYCACALGHGPSAGIAAHPGELWKDYGTRCFTGSSNHLFNYLFSGVWAGHRTERTKAAAVRRIREVLSIA